MRLALERGVSDLPREPDSRGRPAILAAVDRPGAPEPVGSHAPVRSHLEGIVSYGRHLDNNTCAEGLNSLIQFVVAKARGFRNRQRLKMDRFLHFGGLNLYPAKAQ